MLLAVIVALTVLQSAAHLWFVLERSELDTLLDLDRSNGVPDLLSTAVLAAAALGAGVLGARLPGRERDTTLALAVVIAVVAFEDALHFHPGGDSVPAILTAATAGIGLALLGIVACRVTTTTRGRTMIALGLVVVALSLLVGALPELEEWFERSRGDPIIEWQIVAKQGLELAGWWLIALGLWDAASRAEPRV